MSGLFVSHECDDPVREKSVGYSCQVGDLSVFRL